MTALPEAQYSISSAHNYAIERLAGIGGYTYHVSKHGSVYIKFRHKGMKSLRIADHKSLEKYKYKWNFVIGRSAGIENESGIDRLFFSTIQDACQEIDNYYKSILSVEKSVLSILEKNCG